MRPRPLGSLLLLLVLLGGILSAASNDRPPPQPAPTAAQIYRDVLHGVAWIQAAGSGKGTGWIVDRERRWLVTCAHVVGANDIVEVIFPVSEKGRIVAPRAFYLEQYPRLQKDGYAVRGKVLRRERDSDLALVELTAMPPDAIELRLAAAGVSPGERVYAIGTRYDSDALWGFSAGAVRGRRLMREGYFSGGKELGKGARVIEATVPINEGDSGGPLVNSRGEVVGVCAAVEWSAHGAGLFVDRPALLALLDHAGRKRTPAPDQPAVGGASVGRTVYQKAVSAVALVHGPDARLRATGWIIDRQRHLLLTTAEFVGKQEKMGVSFPVRTGDGIVSDASFYRDTAHRVVACVLTTDVRRNLALLEVASFPDSMTELRLATTVPEPGETIHALGNPQGTANLWLYNGGWVRQLGHANLGQTTDGPDPAVILVQATVADGEGGGPLLNDRAELVGVVTGKAAPQQQIAYALTAAEVRAFLEEAKPKWQPRSAAEWCGRAAVFVKAHLYERALLDCNAALEADPSSALACSERAGVQHLRGRDDLALADAERALRLDGKLATAYVHRAAVRIARGEWRAASADCDAALKLDADDSRAHAVRAEARRRLGDLDHALADANEAIGRDVNQPLAYLTRGLIQAQKGDPAHAIADFDRALVHDPELATAYRARADAHWTRSDVAAALDDYNRTLALHADDAGAHLGRGRALVARKDFAGALADFNTAIRLDPRLAAAYHYRGAEQLRRGDFDGAFADFQSALRLQPTLLRAVLLETERQAGELLGADHNDPARALALCQRALRLAQSNIKNRQGIRRIVETGLAIVPDPSHLAEQAAKLRALLSDVCSGLRD